MRGVRKSLEDRKREYRIIYELLEDQPRINIKTIASILDSDRHSASNRLKEIFSYGYALKPQIRKRSYQNMKEYMYFLQHQNPQDAFEKYSNREEVVYLAVLGGSPNFWMITRKPLDVRASVVEGPRSDYVVPTAPEATWDDAFRRIHTKIEEFDPVSYQPHNMIQNHWDECIEWNDEDEKLYNAFQYDLRKKLSPVMKENLISGEKIYKWFDRLEETCTVFTHFFPDGIDAYDPYLLTVDTDYEDFILDLFSQFPTTCTFFKIGERLFCSCYVKRTYLKRVTGPVNGIEDLEIPLIFKILKNRGYVTNWASLSIDYYYTNNAVNPNL